MSDQKSRVKEMDAVEKRLIGLKKSPLYAYRTENKYFPVIGDGSLDSQIMFVGEAPGRNEAKTGKPFQGAAGKILNELLASVKIKREHIYITNIVKDRPPENRDPSPEEIKAYGPLLDAQIEIIQPKAIVALGRYAMSYLMQKFDLEAELRPIGEIHGKAYSARTSYGKVDIVTLYHPCMAIYKRSSLPLLKKDFKILKKYRDEKHNEK